MCDKDSSRLSARPGNQDGILADLMMNPRGRSVKGRANRLSRGRPQREQRAVALSLVKLLGSPVEGGMEGVMK